MGVLYLLVKLDKNYPPLPLVTHPLPLPVRFFPFFPTSRVTTPLRLAPRADLLFRRGQGGRAAHPLPPSLHSGEPSMAGSGRSGPARPPAPPSSSTSMGKTAPRVGLSRQLQGAATGAPPPGVTDMPPSAGLQPAPVSWQGAAAGVDPAMAGAQAGAGGLQTAMDGAHQHALAAQQAFLAGQQPLPTGQQPLPASQ